MSLLETIQALLPELSQSGSSDVIFGRPIEAGGVVLIPVARLSLGVLGLDYAARVGAGGGLSLDPAAVIVVRDRDVNVLEFSRRPHDLADLAPTLGSRGLLSPSGGRGRSSANVPGRPVDGPERPMDPGALIDAVRTVIRELRAGANSLSRHGAGLAGTAAAQAGPRSAAGPEPAPKGRRRLKPPEKAIVQQRPDDIADRRHRESHPEA